MTHQLLEKITSPSQLRRLDADALPQVCSEIRETIVNTISKNGGHLGSSLGATDLIVALHYVFDTPRDRIVFDTGHQAYAHKLLTGRYEKFATVRQKGGISGFLRRDESEYDAFGAGHASTALSAALGMAAARDIKRENRKVVAVVSDGCMTGGMAYEALQNAGHLGTDLLVILNDNQMFISHRVGQLGAFLTKLMSMGTVKNAEQKVENFLNRFDFWGASILRVAKRTKVLLFPGMLFEEMGFAYLGPVDGHDVKKLAEILSRVKEMEGPVVLHVATTKGKGYPPAERRPIAYHGLGIFDKITGSPEPAPANAAPTFTKVFSSTLVKLAETDPRITAITAAMPEGTGLDAFRDRIPERFYDVGIAEEHAVTFAAGQACEGLKPVVALYSSFAQRAWDQVFHDVCLQKLPVVLALDRAGVVGEDGPTHHGVFDLSLFRSIPGLTVLAPADENELQHALKTALDLNAPCVVRYPRGSGFGTPLDAEPAALPYGKGVWLKRGRDLTIIAAGNRAHPAVKAAHLLETKGISCGVINARFVKPLDADIIAEAAGTGKIVTVEDNALTGGFGSAVLEALNGRGISCKTLRLGIPDVFVMHAKPRELYEDLGLTPEKIAARVHDWFRGEN
ncbi:MAG: 1-deoxy-D-xylulose-5-phosphate synthase [Elusimicrobiales bacterium]|nr:1-deoxy-D-xylulose-5-phosphate synthase [Elusimicrobiales bacterium]